MAMNFNTAGEQRSVDLIPDGTIAPVHMTVRPGSAGEGGWLKRTKAGDAMMLDCEFTVTEGPHAKRKFWGSFVTEGTTEGHQKAADISGSRIRAMLESARGVRPDDESEQAQKARMINSWGDLNDMRFIARIGVEKGKGEYKDKNILAEVITPDRKTWARVDQPARLAAVAPPASAGGFQTLGNAAQAAVSKAAPASGKPAWA